MMSRLHNLHIAELQPLLERLNSEQERLQQLINLLSGLTIRVDLPDINPAQLEIKLAGQELIIRRRKGEMDTVRCPVDVVIADDAKMRVAASLAQSMAHSNAAVLIHGATGTGKSLLAGVIHQQGDRSDKPLIKVPGGVLNHPDGVARAAEFVAEAGSGTLILEGVEELEPAAQTTLSRLLQGSTSCRLISLTRTDLDNLVRRGNFSAPLLEQLRDCYIALPDLCCRGSDIEQLSRYYCDKFCSAAGLPHKQLSPEFLDLLALYSWPGNVRELINTLEQSLLCAREQKTLYVKDLPAHIRIQTLQLSTARKKGR